MTIRLICVDGHSLSGKKDMSQWFAKGLRETFQVLDEPLPGFFSDMLTEFGDRQDEAAALPQFPGAVHPFQKRVC